MPFFLVATMAYHFYGKLEPLRMIPRLIGAVLEQEYPRLVSPNTLGLSDQPYDRFKSPLHPLAIKMYVKSYFWIIAISNTEQVADLSTFLSW